MEEKAIKICAFTMLLLTAAFCLFGGRLEKIRAWETDQREALQAEEEYAEETAEKAEMSELDVIEQEESGQSNGQLCLALPEGITGAQVMVENNCLTRTVRIQIPHTDGSYFDSYPIRGSSNHIDSITYMQEAGGDVIEMVMDRVYELRSQYDEDNYYFDFIAPRELYDKVVVIDAGHGGRAGGAVRKRIKEKDINLAIVLKLRALLDENDRNIGVYYTRTDDSNPTFDQRVQLANKSDANLFLSIHNNSVGGGGMNGTSGTQIMYSESDDSEPGSKLLAEICLSKLTSELGSRNKGVIKGDQIYIVRTSEVPVALIEVGFMTNREELALLNSQEYQEQAAKAIYDAILEALEKGY